MFLAMSQYPHPAFEPRTASVDPLDEEASYLLFSMKYAGVKRMYAPATHADVAAFAPALVGATMLPTVLPSVMPSVTVSVAPYTKPLDAVSPSASDDDDDDEVKDEEEEDDEDDEDDEDEDEDEDEDDDDDDDDDDFGTRRRRPRGPPAKRRSMLSSRRSLSESSKSLRAAPATSDDDNVDDDEDELSPNRKARRTRLPSTATSALKEWIFVHSMHPYPSEDDKVLFSKKTGLSLSQINNWFTNARRRLLPTGPAAKASALAARRAELAAAHSVSSASEESN